MVSAPTQAAPGVRESTTHGSISIRHVIIFHQILCVVTVSIHAPCRSKAKKEQRVQRRASAATRWGVIIDSRPMSSFCACDHTYMLDFALHAFVRSIAIVNGALMGCMSCFDIMSIQGTVDWQAVPAATTSSSTESTSASAGALSYQTKIEAGATCI